VKLIRILGIIAILVVAAAIAVPFLVDVNQFRPKLESELSSALGRPVTIGNLKLSLFSGSVAADDLAIGDDPAFSKSPFLRAKSLSAGVELMPLITSRKVNVTKITIDQPEISLLQNAAGSWNYSSLGSKSAPSQPANTAASSGSQAVDLSVKLVKISGGRLTVAKTAGHAKPTVLENVEIELKDFSRSSSMPFSLSAKVAGGGEIKLGGKAGPLPDDMERMPLNASLKISNLDLVATGVADANWGIAGIASIEGSAESDGRQITAKGTITAENVRLVKAGSPAKRPLQFDFALRHDLATRAGSLTQGDVLVGKAKASMTGTYAPRGESVALKANLAGNEMALQELESLLPALNIALPAGSKLDGGNATARMSVEGPLENLVATGTLGLNHVKLSGFNMGQKMAVIEALAGIKGNPTTEIEVLSANVRKSNDGSTIEDLKLVATDIGELTGSGTVMPSHALDFKMRVSVKSAIVPAVLGARAQSGIPFFIRGTAEDPKFEPDLKGMAAGEINNLKGTATKAAEGLLDQLLNKKRN